MRCWRGTSWRGWAEPATSTRRAGSARPRAAHGVPRGNRCHGVAYLRRAPTGVASTPMPPPRAGRSRVDADALGVHQHVDAAAPSAGTCTPPARAKAPRPSAAWSPCRCGARPVLHAARTCRAGRDRGRELHRHQRRAGPRARRGVRRVRREGASAPPRVGHRDDRLPERPGHRVAHAAGRLNAGWQGWYASCRTSPGRTRLDGRPSCGDRRCDWKDPATAAR